MKEAAEKNEIIAARVKFFQFRVPEEFYDYEKDPNALNNLISDPQYRAEIDKLRQKMLEIMKATNDPLMEKFKKILSAP